MPRFAVSIHMDFIADDEEHAATLAYRVVETNAPPLCYSVANEDGKITDMVINRDVAEEFREADDFMKVADGLFGMFKAKG